MKGLKSKLTSKFSVNPYRRGRTILLAPMDALISWLAKRSYLIFRIWERYHAATLTAFNTSSSNSPNCDTTSLANLKRQGFTSLPSTFAAAEIKDARDYVLRLFEGIHAFAESRDPEKKRDLLRWSDEEGEYELDRIGGRTRIYFKSGILESPTLPKVLRDFANYLPLHSLAQAYFDADQIITQRPYFMAEVMIPAPTREPWHIDCFRPTLKAFLNLADVGPGQAPLRYIPGSHHVNADDERRHRQLFEIANGGQGPAYFDRETCRRFDAEAKELVGAENTILAFDVRGAHAGSYCRSGQRITLANGYWPLTSSRFNPRIFRNPTRAPYPWEREGVSASEYS